MIIHARHFRRAFNAVTLFWLFCGSVLLFLCFTVVQDEERVHTTVVDSLLQRSSVRDIDTYEDFAGTETPSKFSMLSPRSKYVRIEDCPPLQAPSAHIQPREPSLYIYQETVSQISFGRE
ncbi:hypothetical protein EON64_06390 [archaeon]|nr:MAG: hypothetical protein EON64_06390 [archaeon]